MSGRHGDGLYPGNRRRRLARGALRAAAVLLIACSGCLGKTAYSGGYFWDSSTELNGTTCIIRVYDGLFVVGRLYQVGCGNAPTPPNWRSQSSQFAGIQFHTTIDTTPGVDPAYALIIPVPYPLSVLVFMSIAAWMASRRISVYKYPHCMGCGYNLTGNTSGKCPECGRAVVKSSSPRR